VDLPIKNGVYDNSSLENLDSSYYDSSSSDPSRIIGGSEARLGVPYVDPNLYYTTTLLYDTITNLS